MSKQLDFESRAGVVAATGHRPDKLGGYYPRALDRVRLVARKHLKRNRPEKLIVGMALGWDQAVAWAAVDLEIPFVAAVPFDGQESRWPKDSQAQYRALLREAESVVYVGERYSAPIPRLMQRRNEWMVDRCESLLALHDGTFGGTCNCLNYAEKLGRPWVNLWDEFERLLQ